MIEGNETMTKAKTARPMARNFAIKTHYMPATDQRGERIIVSCGLMRETIGWDYALDTLDNHAEACRKFCIRQMWDTSRVNGGRLNDSTFVWVRK